MDKFQKKFTRVVASIPESSGAFALGAGIALGNPLLGLVGGSLLTAGIVISTWAQEVDIKRDVLPPLRDGLHLAKSKVLGVARRN